MSVPSPASALALTLHSAPGRYALLLGSGVSYASGIPTGWHVVEDLARRLAAASGIEPPPSDPVAWWISQGGEADYSDMLAAIAPTPAARRDLLAAYFEPDETERNDGLKQPTAAHKAIAALVQRGTVRIIVTTNFDRLLEQAIQQVGIEPVVVASADAAAGMIPLAHTSCTIIKVHGDYLDPSIKNTIGELDRYEPSLDLALDRLIDDYGLVVCGWSADWDPALRAAIERCPSRRYGLFWAARGAPSERALRLISQREGVVVPIDSADEFFTRLEDRINALNDLNRDPQTIEVVVAQAKRWLPDPVHRLKLDDLVTTSALTAIESSRFEFARANSVATYMDQVSAIGGASSDLVAALGVLAGWGNTEEHRSLLIRTLTRLDAPSQGREGGLTSWINLRRYSLLLSTYSAGIAAVANANWDLLTSLLNVELPESESRSHRYLVARVASWNVLDEDAIKSDSGENKKTATSDYLYEFFEPILRPLLRIDDAEFAAAFDQWEYLQHLTTFALGRRAPYGRWIWRNNDPLPSNAVDTMNTKMDSVDFLEPPGLKAKEAEYIESIRSMGAYW